MGCIRNVLGGGQVDVVRLQPSKAWAEWRLLLPGLFDVQLGPADFSRALLPRQLPHVSLATGAVNVSILNHNSISGRLL
jgi:hypothetical protein